MMIRKGKAEDAEAIEEIYQLARKGMKEAGIDQWQGVYPNKEGFLRDVENGVAYVAEEESVIGVAAIILGTDRTYLEIDGKWLTDENEYGVIHRISVHPSARGKGIAGQFMSFTEKLCRGSGLTSMRCDTHKDNKSMQKAMTKFGYEYCGIIICEDGTERMAFEKIIK